MQQIRVGRDVIDPFRVENHDAAYHLWREARIRGRTLLHVDPHHDMWWAADRRLVTIANFVCVALLDDLIDRVYWVVPDGTWLDPRARRALLRQIHTLQRDYPGTHRAIEASAQSFSTSLLGKPFTVCSLAGLSHLTEAVLLDVDADFFTIDRVGGLLAGRPDRPWCWPDRLLAALAVANVSTDFVTVSYSVEGGYTPLRWKYLADEFSVRLADGGNDGPSITGYELMRRGAAAECRHDIPSAKDLYTEAGQLLTGSAAPPYRLAQLAAKDGRLEDARRLYRLVLELDPTYFRSHGMTGFAAYSEGQLAEAETRHRDALMLDPANPYPCLGLALIAAERGHWSEARPLLERALSLDPSLVDAHRALGDILDRAGSVRPAIQAYERSLHLVLRGKSSWTAPIVTEAGPARVNDPDHGLIYARLGRLYASVGDRNRAIQRYRLSLACGHDQCASHARLAGLLLAGREWRQAATQVLQAMLAAIAVLRSLPARLAELALGLWEFAAAR